MSEKVNDGQRSKYIKFRFEDSLRKYQQPPSKRVKLSQPGAVHLSRNNSQTSLHNRLVRLCQTRRLYNAASREKASEYSRRKQAIHQSGKKGCESVSDFNCSGRASVHCKENADYLQLMQCELSKASPVNSHCCLTQNHGFNFAFSFPPTPMKSQQIKQQTNSVEKSIFEFQQINKRNELKVKDIDFHIGLVQELHQQILNEFKKQEEAFADAEQMSQIQQQKQILHQINNQTHQMLNQTLYKNTIPFQFQLQQNRQVQENFEQSQNCQINKIENVTDLRANANQVANVNINPLNDFAIDEMAQIQYQNKCEQKPFPKYDIKCQTQNEENINKVKATPQGRIKINSSAKQFSISARVFYRICRKMKSSTEVVQYVIRSHPYLQGVSEYLEELAKRKSV